MTQPVRKPTCRCSCPIAQSIHADAGGSGAMAALEAITRHPTTPPKIGATGGFSAPASAIHWPIQPEQVDEQVEAFQVQEEPRIQQLLLPPLPPRQMFARRVCSRPASRSLPNLTPAGQAVSHARQPRQRSSCASISAGCRRPLATSFIRWMRPRGEADSRPVSRYVGTGEAEPTLDARRVSRLDHMIQLSLRGYIGASRAMHNSFVRQRRAPATPYGVTSRR